MIGVFCNCGFGKVFTGSTVGAVVVSSRDWKNFKSPNSITIEITHKMTRPIANLPTAHTLTSPVSCPGPGFGGCGCLVSSMFQNLLQVRCVRGHERAFFQRCKEVGQPQPEQSDGNREIQEI